MERTELLTLFTQARCRAESGDLGIADQHAIISDLERRGLNSDKARAVRDKLISAQEVDLTEMERLLDEMDKQG
jgi:hypothetical protein